MKLIIWNCVPCRPFATAKRRSRPRGVYHPRRVSRTVKAKWPTFLYHTLAAPCLAGAQTAYFETPFPEAVILSEGGPRVLTSAGNPSRRILVLFFRKRLNLPV